MNTQRVSRRRAARILPAGEFRQAVAEQLRNPRLKVAVRIDDHLKTSRVEVHGVVAATNLRAIYVVCHRIATKLPGHEVVIDLAHARVSAAVMDELHERARLSLLSSGIDASETPCRLRIVDPRGIIEAREPA